MSQITHRTFLAIARSISPRLHDAIREVGPVRLTRRRDLPLGDLLCRTVAGQQLSGKAAQTIWGRVRDLAAGESVIQLVRRVDLETLRSCGVSGSKAKAMQAIASAAKAGDLDESKLASLPVHERATQLTSIWGVGPWTADMLNMFYFGDQDVWPQGDITVWKTLQRLTDKRRNTEKTAAKFAPKRTYLALYMYKIADQPK